MPMLTETKILSLILFATVYLTACGENQKPPVNPDPKIKAATIVIPTKDTATASDSTAVQPDTTDKTTVAEAALATISTPHYEFTIYRVLPFVPKNDGVGLMKLKQGNRYLVLDVAVKNRSKSKDLDMAQVLLSAKLKDKRGTDYPLNAMAVAAYTLDNPDPQHQAQYNAIWGKLQPGDVYRTFAVGFEVPDDKKEFTLSMNADDNSLRESKRVEAKISVE